MIILGIDPGIAKIGWALINELSGKISAIDFGLFETQPEDSEYTRLRKIHQYIIGLIQKHKPQVLAIEELFFSANVKTALSVGQARGVIILAASQFNLNIFSFTPLQIKQALSGYGRADKRQIQLMVKSILKLPNQISQDDTADALAVGITLAFSLKMNQKITQLNSSFTKI